MGPMLALHLADKRHRLWSTVLFHRRKACQETQMGLNPRPVGNLGFPTRQRQRLSLSVVKRPCEKCCRDVMMSAHILPDELMLLCTASAVHICNAASIHSALHGRFVHT
eukprot:scpid46278/ scgid33916/ 